MALTTIPRTLIGASLKLARTPFDLAHNALGS